jgi:hypothetical protein
MTEVTVDTLRLRGPRAHRLAAVAAVALPAALERALGDVADVQLDDVEVVLDLDPEEYDDQTLAVLWADAIRTGVLSAGGRTRPRPAPPVLRRPVPDAVGSQACAATARAWLATPTREDHGADRLPGPLLELADPVTAEQVAALLGPARWHQLLRRLHEHLDPRGGRSGRPAAPVDIARSDPPRPADRAALARPDRTPTSAPVLGSATRQGSAPASHRHGSGSAADTVPDDLRGLAEVVGVGRTVDLGAVTRVAGLVLLYAWLADHCRHAESLHPGLDPVDVREAALAAIVDPADPADPALLDDPLVRLLSGRPRTPDDASRTRAVLPRHDDVAEAAERVLSSFASLLPGFGRSTPTFVRTSWIVRLGLLDEDHSPALLTAHTLPLDVVLPRLPYPLGLVKLPWSPPLSVRFRP